MNIFMEYKRSVRVTFPDGRRWYGTEFERNEQHRMAHFYAFDLPFADRAEHAPGGELVVDFHPTFQGIIEYLPISLSERDYFVQEMEFAL